MAGTPSLLTIDGVTLSLSDWARRNGLSPHVVHNRVTLGWDPVKAIQTPKTDMTKKLHPCQNCGTAIATYKKHCNKACYRQHKSIDADARTEAFCRTCRTHKPKSEFYSDNTRSVGVGSECKVCVKASLVAWKERNQGRNAETRRSRSNARRRSDPNVAAKARASVLKCKYGLNSVAYDEMLNNQRGVCAICLKSETFCGTGTKPVSLAVDHCHRTGRIRGLLCKRCNTAIHMFDEDIGNLTRVAAYFGVEL